MKVAESSGMNILLSRNLRGFKCADVKRPGERSAEVRQEVLPDGK
jgi:hypothetical protein